jgi:hypothetical protein
MASGYVGGYFTERYRVTGTVSTNSAVGTSLVVGSPRYVSCLATTKPLAKRLSTASRRAKYRLVDINSRG